MDLFFLLVRLLLLIIFVEAGVYETHDAVVTTVNNGFISTSDRLSIPVLNKINPYDLVGQTLVRSCTTFDGESGRCTSVRDCYPYTKLHQSLGPLETWVIGSLGTCHYTEASGRQVYGVCCQRTTLRPQSSSSLILDRNKASLQLMKQEPIPADSRIVNGENVPTSEFPFMAAIVDSKSKPFCGGTLLDDRHVLTAAHCFMGFSPTRVSQLTVVLGVVDLQDSNKILRRIKTVVRHSMFDSRKMQNDIAIITLDTPVTFNADVSPACIDGITTKNYDENDAVTIGWGRLSESGKKPANLQKVTLQVKSQEECRTNLGSKAPGGVADHYLCAWSHSKDSCSGDSGGPIIHDGCVIGLVSWGIGCATDLFGVYTRISSFRNWIDKYKALY